MKTEQQSILIVDDDRMNIQALTSELGLYYHIFAAKNGRQAFRILSEHPVDLVLLNPVMPGLDGYDVCRRLKANPLTSHIPIVFVTSAGDGQDEARGLNLGAADYIRRPFNMPIVKARIKNLLELKMKSDLLQHLASLDGLTNIANRKKFDETLRMEWNRASRNNYSLSMLLIDLDDFKSYNDNYGYSAGDDCLRRVARGLQGGLFRTSDFLARYGGEEFAVLLPSSEMAGAIMVAEKLRTTVEDLEIPHSYSSCGHSITVSIGVSFMHPTENPMSPMNLTEEAERLMIRAKERGRNCVEVEIQHINHLPV